MMSLTEQSNDGPLAAANKESVPSQWVNNVDIHVGPCVRRQQAFATLDNVALHPVQTIIRKGRSTEMPALNGARFRLTGTDGQLGCQRC